MVMPTEYKEYLQANLNLIERIGQTFSALDERIDYTNILLTELVKLQGGAPPTEGVTPYNDLIRSMEELSSTLKKLKTLVVPNRETFLTGTRTVTTAGTAVQLTTSSIPIPDEFGLTIIAKPANVGTIYLGITKGDAEGGMKFDGLTGGLAVSLKITDVNLVWVNTDTDGEGVSWIVER